jgi:hypothetical protein
LIVVDAGVVATALTSDRGDETAPGRASDEKCSSHPN